MFFTKELKVSNLTTKIAAVSCTLVIGPSMAFAAPAQECDVVIIGAGGAGISSAIALKEAGKQKVCLIEKMPFVGGATNLAATYFTVINTREQQAAGKGQSIEKYLESKKKQNYPYDMDRLKEFSESSQEALDWVNKIGANITRPMSSYQMGTADGRSLGNALILAMKKKLDESGVVPMLSTKATKLVTKDGKITGVMTEGKDGEKLLKTNYVIVATGGYSSGQEVLKKFAPEWAGLPSTSAVGSTGDAVGLLEPLNAKFTHMDVLRLNPSVHSSNGQHYSLSAARAEGGIMVNAEGKRFCNDYFPDYTQLSKWMLAQPGGYAYIVIDDKAMQKSKRLQGFKAKGFFLEAPTIPELAKKMGVPEKNFVATVERYAGFVKNGKDEDFGRKHNLSLDFSTGPFYAVKTTPGVQVTLGGVQVDKNLRVVGTNGKPIPGLYAVGEVADDGLFGTGPTHINVYYGKKAAENVLAEEKLR